MLDINDEKLKRGYIKLFRCIDSWEWYSDTSVKVLFLHILIKANHTEKIWRGITIQQGSFITSYENLSKETGLTYKQVRLALSKLKKTGEVAHKGTSQYSIITVNNWEQYQEIGQTVGQPEGSQRATTNNDNNVNNINIYGAEKNKKFDPYFNNPVTDKFKSEYNKIYKSKCYLDNYKINKLLEISSENPNFTEKLPEILNKFSKLKFFKGEKATKPTLKWLILEGGWAGILNGEYDQFIDKPAPELKKDWTTNELLTCDTSIYDDKEVDGWSL